LADYAPPMADPPPPDQPTDQPRRAPGIEANEAHGRVVLVRPDDGGFYLLDELGTRIWKLCDGERSVEQVIATIGEETDQPPPAVAGDVREWISELRTEQLMLGSD
jgi:Coenzyme PQQ synthesis protein D (PqqD)